MEKDNWVSDPDVLAKITADQDLKGEWWQIPDKELQKCLLGSCASRCKWDRVLSTRILNIGLKWP